jgi:hypothetical protein
MCGPELGLKWIVPQVSGSMMISVWAAAPTERSISSETAGKPRFKKLRMSLPLAITDCTDERERPPHNIYAFALSGCNENQTAPGTLGFATQLLPFTNLLIGCTLLP